jgi:hypothetical protein
MSCSCNPIPITAKLLEIFKSLDINKQNTPCVATHYQRWQPWLIWVSWHSSSDFPEKSFKEAGFVVERVSYCCMLAVQARAALRIDFLGSEKDQIFLANTMILEMAETKAAAKARAIAKVKAIAKARAAAKARAWRPRSTVRSRAATRARDSSGRYDGEAGAPANICLDNA